MFFSVIIPIYNSSKTIDRCLNSVLHQTFNDYEVLMINDGSSDDSEIICKEFESKDKRFRYYYQKNQGVSTARNQGIENASGDFIVFLDSDDEYEKTYLEKFFDLIEDYPNYDNYWCGYTSQVIGSDSQTITVHEDSKVSFVDKKKMMNLHEEALDASPVNKAYKMTIIDQNHIRMNPDISLGEDMLFNYEYMDFTSREIVILNEPLYRYYVGRGDSLDNKYRENMEEIYDQLDKKLLFYLNKWNVDKDQYTLFYNSVFYNRERIMRNTFHKDSPKTILQKLRINNKILRSKKFIDVMKMSSCYIHPLYRMAYRSQQYILIILLNKIVQLRKGWK